MDFSVIFAWLAQFIVTVGITALVWYILQIIAYWRVFAKAGIPGFLSLIPILNVFLEFKLAWNGKAAVAFFLLSALSGFLPYLSAFLDAGSAGKMILSLASFVVMLLLAICVIRERFKLARSFGKGFFFALGLLFLEPVFLMILGFGSAAYHKKK